MQGSALTNAKVALAGYCITTAADFLFMLLGDHMCTAPGAACQR